MNNTTKRGKRIRAFLMALAIFASAAFMSVTPGYADELDDAK